MKNINKPIWIHQGAPLNCLVFVWRLMLGLFLIRTLLPVTQLAELPVEWLSPVFPWTLIPFPAFSAFIQSSSALICYQIAVAGVLFFGFLINPARNLGVVIVVMACISHSALIRSYTYMNHAEVGLLLCMVTFALNVVIRRVSGETQEDAGSILFSITAVFLFGYSIMGAHRLSGPNGLSLFTRPYFDVWLIDRSLLPGVIFQNSFGIHLAQIPSLTPLLRLGFFASTILELLAPLALFSTAFRRLFVLCMIPMHIGIMLLMNIFFFENIGLMLLLVNMGKPEVSKCIILFDGVCNFCGTFVRWVIPKDPDGLCLFAASESDSGRELIAKYGLTTEAIDSSIHVIVGDKVYTRSTAVLAILSRLKLPWRLFQAGEIVPLFIRDWLYRRFSANRYQWFGKADSCYLPAPEERQRFI